MLEDEYQLDFFKNNGFIRKQCHTCGKFFWTRDLDRNTCGDAPCDPYSFIGSPIFSREFDISQMREYYLSFFQARGHKRIDRYPVIARWRDDIYLTIASIADFQPFVTSGQVPPPAANQTKLQKFMNGEAGLGDIVQARTLLSKVVGEKGADQALDFLSCRSFGERT